MNALEVIGQNISKSRKDKGWSQEDLAGAANMDRSYLSEIENGHKNLSVMTLIKISMALDVSLTDLLKGV